MNQRWKSVYPPNHARTSRVCNRIGNNCTRHVDKTGIDKTGKLRQVSV